MEIAVFEVATKPCLCRPTSPDQFHRQSVPAFSKQVRLSYSARRPLALDPDVCRADDISLANDETRKAGLPGHGPGVAPALDAQERLVAVDDAEAADGAMPAHRTHRAEPERRSGSGCA